MRLYVKPQSGSSPFSLESDYLRNAGLIKARAYRVCSLLFAFAHGIDGANPPVITLPLPTLLMPKTPHHTSDISPPFKDTSKFCFLSSSISSTITYHLSSFFFFYKGISHCF